MRRGVSSGGLVSAFTLSALFFVPAGLWFFGVPLRAEAAASGDLILPHSGGGTCLWSTG